MATPGTGTCAADKVDLLPSTSERAALEEEVKSKGEGIVHR